VGSDVPSVALLLGLVDPLVAAPLGSEDPVAGAVGLVDVPDVGAADVGAAELGAADVGVDDGDVVVVGVPEGLGELVGSDGDPIVTDWPVLPVVVVVVVPSLFVVVVVVPPVEVVTGHETDLALITTPGPKLHVLVELDALGLVVAVGELLGVGEAGTIVVVVVGEAGAVTTMRRVVVTWRVVVDAVVVALVAVRVDDVVVVFGCDGVVVGFDVVLVAGVVLGCATGCVVEASALGADIPPARVIVKTRATKR